MFRFFLAFPYHTTYRSLNVISSQISTLLLFDVWGEKLLRKGCFRCYTKFHEVMIVAKYTWKLGCLQSPKQQQNQLGRYITQSTLDSISPQTVTTKLLHSFNCLHCAWKCNETLSLPFSHYITKLLELLADGTILYYCGFTLIIHDLTFPNVWTNQEDLKWFNRLL